MPSAVDFNTMPVMRPIVATFRLVCAVNRDKSYLNRRDSPLRSLAEILASSILT